MKEQNSWVSSEGCKELWGTAGKLPVWGSPQLMVSWGAGGGLQAHGGQTFPFSKRSWKCRFLCKSCWF